MLRKIYLLVFIVVVQTDVMNELFNNNGWTPITRDQAFSILERKLVGQEFSEDIYKMNKINFVTEKSDNNQGIIQEVVGPRYVNFSTNRNERQSYSNKPNGTESNKYNYERNALSGIYRKPKVISSYSINDINNLASTNINEITEKIDNTSKEKLIEDSSGNQYEVTERNEVEQLFTQQNIFNIRTEQIDKQNITEIINPETNTFTSKLLSILSNYNIRENDELPNYKISRNLKRNSTNQEYFLLPIPIRYSTKFNHFATNPMLVLFLSNYGFYTPNQYGRSMYSNLYGHLASNIYKRGSYKIYSDTDSSQ